MQAPWQARCDGCVRVIYLCADWMRLRGVLELSVSWEKLKRNRDHKGDFK